MGKLKSVVEECNLTWFFSCGFFLCFFLMFYSIAEAKKVKYFGVGNCGIFKYDDKCKFRRQIDRSDLAKAWGYFEVHYKEGKMTNAILVNKSKLNEETPSVAEKLEFDSKERLILHEYNLHGQYPGDYELCKLSYDKQIKETRCYDKQRKLRKRESSIYKDNFLVKSSRYDESGKLKQYSTFDHEAMIEKVFTPDHKLLQEREMLFYFG